MPCHCNSLGMFFVRNYCLPLSLYSNSLLFAQIKPRENKRSFIAAADCECILDVLMDIQLLMLKKFLLLQAVILQPLGDRGIAVIGGDTIRGFTTSDQVPLSLSGYWISILLSVDH